MIHGGKNKFRNGKFYVPKKFVVHKNVLGTCACAPQKLAIMKLNLGTRIPRDVAV